MAAYVYEYGDFWFDCSLNEIGKILIKWVERMENVGIVTPSEEADFVSKAYWHKKET